jgi:hypothetical protein
MLCRNVAGCMHLRARPLQNPLQSKISAGETHVLPQHCDVLTPVQGRPVACGHHHARI